MIVIDASVAVKWIVEESSRDTALRILMQEHMLAAPDLMLAEFASVIRKKKRSGQLAAEQVMPALDFVRKTIGLFVPTEQLAAEALLLSEQMDHSPYDCFYLACALSRGQLLTADEKFAEKCRSHGYARVVVSLSEFASGRLDAIRATMAVNGDVLNVVARLAPIIRQSFASMEQALTREQAGPFKFVPADDYDPVFSSPAYVSLAKTVSGLSDEQQSVLLALGWLGRSYHSGHDWTNLIENARSGLISEGFGRHRSYIMAQMSDVPAGLAKLQAHFDLGE